MTERFTRPYFCKRALEIVQAMRPYYPGTAWPMIAQAACDAVAGHPVMGSSEIGFQLRSGWHPTRGELEWIADTVVCAVRKAIQAEAEDVYWDRESVESVLNKWKGEWLLVRFQNFAIERRERAAETSQPSGSDDTPSAIGTPLQSFPSEEAQTPAGTLTDKTIHADLGEASSSTGNSQAGLQRLIEGKESIGIPTAARYLDLSPGHVGRLVRTGKLTRVGQGRPMKVSTRSLREYKGQ